MEFQPFLDSSCIMLVVLLCSYYSSFIMLHETAEKKEFLSVDFVIKLF